MRLGIIFILVIFFQSSLSIMAQDRISENPADGFKVIVPSDEEKLESESKTHESPVFVRKLKSVPGKRMETAGIVITSIGIPFFLVGLVVTIRAIEPECPSGESTMKCAIKSYFARNTGLILLGSGLVMTTLGGILWGVGRNKRTAFLKSVNYLSVLPVMDRYNKKMTGGILSAEMQF